MLLRWLHLLYIIIVVVIIIIILVFQDRVSLCSSGCPGTHSVEQADLEVRNPPASASGVLGLKAWATMLGLPWFYSSVMFYFMREALELKPRTSYIA